jgi:hypothetical protein
MENDLKTLFARTTKGKFSLQEIEPDGAMFEDLEHGNVATNFPQTVILMPSPA